MFFLVISLKYMVIELTSDITKTSELFLQNCKKLVGWLRPQAPENQSIALWLYRFPVSSSMILYRPKKEKCPCPGKCYSLAFLFRAGVFLAIFPFAAGMIFFFREDIPHQNITIIFDMIESRKLRFQLFQGELVLLFVLAERVIFR